MSKLELLDSERKIWACAACGKTQESFTRPLACACGVLGAFFPKEAPPGPFSDESEPPADLASEDLLSLSATGRGHPTGISALDRATGGFPLGTSGLIYGPSTSGKSTLALRIVAGLPRPGLLVVPEMSPEMTRTIADRSGANLSGLRRYSGSLEGWPGEADRLLAAVVLIDSISKFYRPASALSRLIDWTRAAPGRIGLAISHESRRARPLNRAEYEPDFVMRVVRRGSRRTARIDKCRWNGFLGEVRLVD